MPPSSASPVIYDCQERHAVNLPLDHVLLPNGKLDILPAVASKGYFDIDYRGDTLSFVAGRYVGLIPINDRVLIDVKPKVPVKNLLRLIEIAGEELGVLHFFDRDYQEQPTLDQSILDLLIKTLLKQLRAVEQEGVHKVYRREPRSGAFRPKINFARTLQTQWSRGNFTRTNFDLFEYSRDNPLNRLLKYTLWYCGNFVGLRTGNAETRRSLAFFFNLLEQVPLDTSLSFVAAAQWMLQSEQIPALRSYYNDIVRTCLYIVGNRSISLEVRGADISLLSFVLNLEDVFEKYIRNILKHASLQLRPDLRVLNGNTEIRSYLFCDSKGIEIKPDIIVKKDKSVVLLSDVKYKPKLSEVDRYQIIAHAYSMSAGKAVIVLPAFAGGQSGPLRRGRVRRDNGVDLFEYHFPLDIDLELQEKEFAAQMFATL